MRRTETARGPWKLNSVAKFFLVAAILVGEVYVVGLFTWAQSKQIADAGYLIKNGDGYILYWRTAADVANGEMRTLKYESLNEALKFAREELELRVGSRPAFADALEHQWIRSDIGKSVLYFKTLNINFLNRLTFKREADARFFQNAFRSGAYSTSPLGHSIALVPLFRTTN